MASAAVVFKVVAMLLFDLLLIVGPYMSHNLFPSKFLSFTINSKTYHSSTLALEC